MIITKNIALDFSGGSIRSLVEAKQGDNATRFVCATLMKNGVTYLPPEGTSARFRCLKPDGCSCDNPAWVNGDGTVTVELTKQTLAVPGTVKADIVLEGADGQVLSTASFLILVDDAPVGEQIESSNEFLSLTELVEKNERLLGEYETALAQLEGIRDEAKEYAHQAAVGGSGGTFAATGDEDALVITTTMQVSADGDAITIGGM